MKTLFFIYFTLLLGSQASFFDSPTQPLEHYRAYLQGVCTAVNADCDLAPLSSCWDDNSALGALTMIYQASKDVAGSTPVESHNKLKAFFEEGHAKYILPISDSLKCEANLPYSRLFYEKIGMKGQGFDDLLQSLLEYATFRPGPCFIALKNMAALAEQGNFEAVGLLDGNFMSQAAALKASHWRRSAKESRRLLLKGMCESLSLECPMETLNSMDEEASAADLNLFYQWAKTVASHPMGSASAIVMEFYLGPGKELLERIPKSAIENERNSVELRLMNEKYGFDVWGAEWLEACIEFPKEFQELYWHYKVSEYQLIESGDFEGAGVVFSLEWYQVAEWKKGRLGKKDVEMTDL